MKSAASLNSEFKLSLHAVNSIYNINMACIVPFLEQHNYCITYVPTIICTSDMLSRNILNWLVLLLTLATVTRSEHYHIVPVDSTDSCQDYRNGTCFSLEQLVQTHLLSGGDNLTLIFLPGDHNYVN